MTSLPDVFLRSHFAHRGLHQLGAGRVENSRAACLAAIAGGYGIEMDLQLSADGEAMVFHDNTLDRLTPERGPVRQRPVRELVGIPLTGGGETIPTLANILALVEGRAPLLIEIKDQDGALGPNVGELERRAVELLTGYDGPMALMSFNAYSVAVCQEAGPQIARGLVTVPMSENHWPDVPPERRAALTAIEDFDRVGASFVSHYHRALPMAEIARLKARGVPIFCWTVRNAREASEALRIADAITFENFLP